MEFKTSRIEKEWDLVKRDSPSMAAVMLYCDQVSLDVAGIGIEVTDLLRLSEEQLALCIKIGVDPYRSVHEYLRGFDLDTDRYTTPQRILIVDLVTEVFEYAHGYPVLAMHTRGTADHLHGQVPHTMRWKG